MSDAPEKTPEQRAEERLGKEKYARLVAEARAPYRGLRKTLYVAFGASGFLGGLVLLGRLASGADPAATLGSIALQAGLVAAMVWAFRLEQRVERHERDRDRPSS